MNKKTILVTITGVLLAVAGGAVGATLSRYQSMATTTPVLNVAKWHVVVGNEDISKGEAKTFNAKINWTNDLAAEGVMAPGSTGTITFTIDGKDTQVPIDYEININTDSIKDHEQIKIKNVTSTVENEQPQDLTGSNPYKSTIELADMSKPVTITINLEWENQEGKNEDDTSLGVGNGEANTVLSLPVTVTASQKVA